MRPQIGETVLFKIDTKDFGVWRPLIVTYVDDEGKVSGEVIFNVERDAKGEWPQRYLFTGLIQQGSRAAVKNVVEGEDVGCYKQMKIDPAIDQHFAVIYKKLQDLGALGKQQQPPAKALVPEKRIK